MKRSSLSPQDAMASSRRLLLAPPHPYLPTPNPPPSPRSLHIPSRSPSRQIDVTDDVDDDLFGSAAWKKKRGKRATKVGQDNGEDMSNYNTRRWALVQLLEQRFRRVTGHVLKLRKWLADVFRGSESDVEGTSDGLHSAGGMNGSAVPTANGAVTATARQTSSDLSSEALVQEARRLCSSYIYHRLSTKGLMSRRVPVAPHSTLVSEELCSAGQELEKLYPRVYTDVSRRISMTMTSAQIVRRALTSVLDDLFRSGVTWAKVVSMVAISAAFAEECVVQGHPKFVEDVVMCVGHFVTQHLTSWLARQGGWSSFPTSRPPVAEKPSADGVPPLYFSVVVVVVSLVLVLLLCRLILAT